MIQITCIYRESEFPLPNLKENQIKLNSLKFNFVIVFHYPLDFRSKTLITVRQRLFTRIQFINYHLHRVCNTFSTPQSGIY